MKVNISLLLCIDGLFGCNNLQRYLARLQLKLIIDETIGWRGGKGFMKLRSVVQTRG